MMYFWSSKIGTAFLIKTRYPTHVPKLNRVIVSFRRSSILEEKRILAVVSMLRES